MYGPPFSSITIKPHQHKPGLLISPGNSIKAEEESAPERTPVAVTMQYCRRNEERKQTRFLMSDDGASLSWLGILHTPVFAVNIFSLCLKPCSP